LGSGHGRRLGAAGLNVANALALDTGNSVEIYLSWTPGGIHRVSDLQL
jgi:hypothetical protein